MAYPTKQELLYRNTDFDPLKAEQICRLLSEGIEVGNETESRRKALTITKVCAEVGITRNTLRIWLARYPDFAANYEAAQHIFADRMMEEALEIADDNSLDMVTGLAKDGKTVIAKPDMAAVSRAKLRVEFRKHLASKLHPHKYGDKLQIDSRSVVVHVDETTEGLQLQLKNLIQGAVNEGYDMKQIMATLGLTEVNVLPEDYAPRTQDLVPKMLEEPMSFTIPAK